MVKASLPKKKNKKQKSNVHNICVDLVYKVNDNDYDSIIVVEM